MVKLTQPEALRFLYAMNRFCGVLTEGIGYATNDDCADSKYYEDDVPYFYDTVKGIGKRLEKDLSSDAIKFERMLKRDVMDASDFELVAERVNEKLEDIVNLFYGEEPFDVNEALLKIPVALMNYEKNIPKKFRYSFRDTRDEYLKALTGLFEDAGMRKGADSLFDCYDHSYDAKFNRKMDSMTYYLDHFTFSECFEDDDE